MNPQDVFYVEKYLQIMYRAINNAKIHPKLTTDGSKSGGISPLHPYCSRDYRSSSHGTVPIKTNKKNVHAPNPLTAPYSANML